MTCKLRSALQDKYQKATSTTSSQAMLDLYQLMPALATEPEEQLIDLLFDIERVCVPQFLRDASFPEK